MANADVGPLLQEKIIRVSPATPVPDRITALLPDQSQTDALKRYFAPLLEKPEPIAVPGQTAENKAAPEEDQP